MNHLVNILANLISPLLPVLIQILWSRLALEHLSGAYVARLLRWLLVSGAASAGGGTQRVYYEWAWIPRRNESAIADSFFFILGLDRAAMPVELTRIGIPGFLAVDIDTRHAGSSRYFKKGIRS